MGLVALTEGGTEPPFVGNPNLGSNQNQPLAYAFETQNLLLVDGIERGTQIGRLCMLLNGNIWILEDSFEWEPQSTPGCVLLRGEQSFSAEKNNIWALRNAS